MTIENQAQMESVPPAERALQPGFPPFTPGFPSPQPPVTPGFPFPQPPVSPGFPAPLPPGQPGLPSQLSPTALAGILGQYPRPVGSPPYEMIFLYNLLKSNPFLLQTFITQRPQSLQQAMLFAQTGAGAGIGAGVQREPDERILPRYCYNRWSLVFTFTDVFLMFPVTNFFGFVIGYCYPFLSPCIIPNFQIIFALC
ncbi:hypothetical protein [Paenibacillus beijingensis]|uniref:Uncharacterized protein n=1 Tax=Paenibacillus beijingensis TaxID=1126833 RepID=A0A0D5NKN9_9BACL|nr:hypothetical protein [Paenibacillus beijingensis]AJY75816.1 hypothetical protein VN24_16225 [Paenibacillus beijingensis]